MAILEAMLGYIRGTAIGSDSHVLHGESNKGLASPRTQNNGTIKTTNHQATTKQRTKNTINLCTNHPALHPHEYPSHNASDPRSSKAKTKCPQPHTNHTVHAHESTSNPQPSRHSLYVAQASRRAQPTITFIYIHIYRLAWYKRRMKNHLPPPP